MLQSTRLRAARSLAARNRAFFTCARNAIGSGPLAGADPCAPARDASAATATAAMAISNVRSRDMVPPTLTVLGACGEYSRVACSAAERPLLAHEDNRSRQLDHNTPLTRRGLRHNLRSHFRRRRCLP